MSDNEIVRSYIHSGYRTSQIQVLAELNAVNDKDIDDLKYKIVCILKDAGILRENKVTRRIEFKAAGREAFDLFSAYIADCLTAFDKASPKEQAEYLKDIEEVRTYLFERRFAINNC